MLPPEVKQLLWYSDHAPTFEDLRVAWQLAGETFDLKDVVKRLNVFENDRKEAKRKEKEEKLRREKQERFNNRAKKFGRQLYTLHRVVNKPPRDKDVRLIRLAEEEAVERLSKRKENKDIRPVGGLVKRYVGREDLTKKEKPEDEIKFHDFDNIPNNITKQMHNS